MKTHTIPEHQFPLTLDDNVHILGNYFFNLFLVIGENASALFEVGVSGVIDTVIAQLEGLDVYPDFIIPSHPHSDHITGLPGLVEKFPGAVVIAARGAKEFIDHPKAGPVLVKEDLFMSKSLEQFGIKPGRPPLEKKPILDDALVVHEKKSLDLGRITLDLVKVGGHSPGNLMAIVPEKKIVFCSDSMGFHFPGRGFLPLFFTQADSYLSTLTFIRDMAPSTICPAHQGPLTGKEAARGIQESLNITRDLLKKIKTSSRSDDALAREIFEQSYKDEFTLYTPENIKNCAALLVKRAKENVFTSSGTSIVSGSLKI